MRSLLRTLADRLDVEHEPLARALRHASTHDDGGPLPWVFVCLDGEPYEVRADGDNLVVVQDYELLATTASHRDMLRADDEADVRTSFMLPKAWRQALREIGMGNATRAIREALIAYLRVHGRMR